MNDLKDKLEKVDCWVETLDQSLRCLQNFNGIEVENVAQIALLLLLLGLDLFLRHVSVVTFVLLSVQL
jgi:hypothetical protein